MMRSILQRMSALKCERGLGRISASIEIRLLRWSTTILVALAALETVYGISGGRIDEVPWFLAAAAALQIVYYAHLLCARLRCSLLEFGVAAILAGNVIGLAASRIGQESIVYLCPFVLAWVLSGLVSGLVKARLLGVNRPVNRLGLILLAWMLPACIASILLGSLLYWSPLWKVAGETLRVAALPMVCCGTVAFLFYCVLELRVIRAAKSILATRTTHSAIVTETSTLASSSASS